MCLATANLPASLTVNSLFPQSPRRTTKQPLLRGFRAVFETINDLPENMRWCGRRDSNSHTLRRQNLNLVCLPISPRPQTSKRKRQAVPGAPAYGVDDGVRTHDRRSHNPVLYQLSYAHHIALLVPEPKYGAPGRTRTCDHPLRRRMLYPAELRALLSAFCSERRLEAPAIERSRLLRKPSYPAAGCARQAGRML